MYVRDNMVLYIYIFIYTVCAFGSYTLREVFVSYGKYIYGTVGINMVRKVHIYSSVDIYTVR